MHINLRFPQRQRMHTSPRRPSDAMATDQSSALFNSAVCLPLQVKVPLASAASASVGSATSGGEGDSWPPPAHAHIAPLPQRRPDADPMSAAVSSAALRPRTLPAGRSWMGGAPAPDIGAFMWVCVEWRKSRRRERGRARHEELWVCWACSRSFSKNVVVHASSTRSAPIIVFSPAPPDVS